MRVLFIAYHFPPDAEIGAVRPYQFARLLPQYGVEPWILTVRPEDAERYDAALRIEDIPPERIVRTAVDPSRWVRVRQAVSTLRGGGRKRAARSVTGAGGPVTQAEVKARPVSPMLISLSAWFEYPDQRAGWYRHAREAAARLVREQGIEAVFSTSPPRVTHLVARDVSRETRIPWVMDLRDPWQSHWGSDVLGGQILARMQQRLFAGCIRSARRVVTNTERLGKAVAGQFPATASKVVAIPNGCTVRPGAGTVEGTERFTIGYFGQLMGKRTARPFLEGLRLWIDRDAPDLSQVEVRFVGFEGGGSEPEAMAAIERLQLGQVVSVRPPVPRAEVAGLLQQSYVLLLIANDQPLQIPGKVFEYLGAQRRILAVTEREGATADMLAGQKPCMRAMEPAGIADALGRAWRDYAAGAPAVVDYSALLDACSYDRRAEQLASVFSSLRETRQPESARREVAATRA